MKLLLQVLQKNRCRGFSNPSRALGAVWVLPLRLVSRLPQRGQRTRRFSHPEASYPVVYRIATAKRVPELGFRASNGPTQLDAVGFCIGDMGQRGGASSRIQQNQALGAQPRSNGTGEEASGLSRDAKLSAVSFLALDGSHELKCDSVRVFEVQVVTE